MNKEKLLEIIQDAEWMAEPGGSANLEDKTTWSKEQLLDYIKEYDETLRENIRVFYLRKRMGLEND